MKLWSKVWQIFLLFSLYFSSLNLKYLKLTKMELTRFAMKLFKYFLNQQAMSYLKSNENHHMAWLTELNQMRILSWSSHGLVNCVGFKWEYRSRVSSPGGAYFNESPPTRTFWSSSNKHTVMLWNVSCDINEQRVRSRVWGQVFAGFYVVALSVPGFWWHPLIVQGIRWESLLHLIKGWPALCGQIKDSHTLNSLPHIEVHL